MTDETIHRDEIDHDTEAPASETEHVEVRRNVALSAVVGALSAALTAAFAVRAFGEGATLDWAAFAVLAVITVVHAAALVDGRAPLLVADRLGVRLRRGARWQGIAWEDVECLEHLPRRLARDGHLLVVGNDGEQLVVPLTLATRIVGADRAGLSDELAELADGRADVVEVVPGLEEDMDEPGPDDVEDTTQLERRWLVPDDDHDLAAPAPRADAGDDSDTVDSIPPVVAEASTDEIAAVADTASEADPSPGPGRAIVMPARVEMQWDRADHGPGAGGHPIMGANALHVDQTPEAGHTLTVVLDDLAVHPAEDPVIGPQIQAARERLRLTVDQLSDRTRIRPHVIEAIEVDDFGPCGGDFYARGHLRTLARVLGIDAGPLVATYDEKYADAPVDPRRVFESELATGVGGSIRGTRGGRNWSVLVAAVMAAVLIWSIARLLMGDPAPLDEPSVLSPSSNGISNGSKKAAALPVTLTAAGGGAKLVVRDGGGDIVFDGQLAFGQTSELRIVPPVRIWTSDGSVTVSLDGGAATPLGKTGEEVTKTLVAP